MKKNIISKEAKQQICADYENLVGIENLAYKYHIGKLKVKEILKENGITFRTRNSARILRNFVVSDYRIEKYPEEKGFHYEAVSKDGKIKFNDYMNKGGFLTSYIKKEYGIDTPTLYDRRIYYQTTGNYWWEQWFDIIKVKDKETKKCPYCDWETIDTDNRSGMFLTHLLKEHNISIEKYLNEHPEDEQYFSTQKLKILRKDKLNETNDFVVCPLCQQRFQRITFWHLRKEHGITDYCKFKKDYPNVKIMNDELIKLAKESVIKGNLVVSKKRFVSIYEKELQDFLSKHNISFNANRQILIGKEIDLLIEDKKIGIEFDGLKFHTEWFGRKAHNYHLQKTLMCNEKGYGLIHIFEDEYVNNKELVFKKILHILGKADGVKIMGRKCIIREIKKFDAETFLNKFHLQGFASGTAYLGAYYNENLIGVMVFKMGNLKNPSWELVRFATDYNYICQGVGGKIFNEFIKMYNPNKIISFADRRWTINIHNNLYTKLGFTIDKINPPDYRYYNEKIDRFKRVHKMFLNKQKLHKLYGFPLTMTETEMAKELKYDRIWDCGLIKYVWKKENNNEER